MIINLIIGLLVLLAISVVVGIVRKLGGGTFLPQPGPGEDHLFMDKTGRWWRRDEQTGVLEEVMRRPSRRDPIVTKSVLWGIIRYFLTVLLWIMFIGGIFAVIGIIYFFTQHS
jgi:hypothetical protein